MDLTKNPLYFPICFLQQKMEPSTSSRRPKNPRKNQGPVRQHGLNLVKGICTGSQVRSWHFFFGENPPGCLLKGGETYLRVSNLSNVAVCLGPGNKKKLKQHPPPQKEGWKPSITGGWCFPLRHIVDVGVRFFSVLAGLHGNWHKLSIPNRKGRYDIYYKRSGNPPKPPATLTWHISNVKSKMWSFQKRLDPTNQHQWHSPLIPWKNYLCNYVYIILLCHVWS